MENQDKYKETIMKSKFKDILHYLISFIPFIAFISLIPFLMACEKDITIVIPEGEEDLVVYGFIEQYQRPVIILTKSLPVFAANDIETIQNSFVHSKLFGGDAVVKIFDGINTVELIELELDTLQALKIYIYTTKTLLGKIGKTYSLSIEAEGKKLSATTSILPPILLDSLWWMPHPDPKKDSLVVFWVRYTDPPSERNYVRYFTKRNQEPFFPGYFISVFNDELFDGESFNFPLERGQDEDPRDSNDNGHSFDPSYGFFIKGDKIIIKWCSIDKAHFDFWRTLEVDKNSTGNPFGSPTKIISNIDGGLGIWGGYGASYATLEVK